VIRRVELRRCQISRKWCSSVRASNKAKTRTSGAFLIGEREKFGRAATHTALVIKMGE